LVATDRFEQEGRMSTSRRAFLETLGFSSAALCFAPWGRTTSRAASVPASERISLGFIGVGSHGLNVNLKTFLGNADAQVVALCDVDSNHLHEAEQLVRDRYSGKGKALGAGLFLTGDFRELVIRDDIDAVIVSTPDHWHVLASLGAIRNGKDVYCEKPLSRTIAEGRVLADETARCNRIFQTGSEFRGTYNFHRAAELVRNGYIGALQEIKVFLPRNPLFPGDPQPMLVPKELDYDMWLGPAPVAPYTVDRVHFNYRWILDYSVGMLADWGGHLLDQAQWAVDREFSGPVSVQAQGRFLTEGLFNTAVDFKVEYEYDNGVRMVCDDRHPEKSGGIR
jgi:predicted dehydrogenase